LEKSMIRNGSYSAAGKVKDQIYRFVTYCPNMGNIIGIQHNGIRVIFGILW
jgi:hypothetical protein